MNLSEYFLKTGCKTRVIVAPCTIDNNISPKHLETTIGFDTSTKCFSQYVGNMLSDAASALKYWYFVKVMGSDCSNSVLEIALQTHANFTLISEETLQRRQTIEDIVARVADVICLRQAEGKNYGCILIPECLPNYLTCYRTLFDEINKIFEGKTEKETLEMSQKMLTVEGYLESLISEWCYKVYINLPKSVQTHIIDKRALQGPVKVSQIHTEVLLADLVAKELDKRKAKGEYKGGFQTVTHYFGY